MNDPILQKHAITNCTAKLTLTSLRREILLRLKREDLPR